MRLPIIAALVVVSLSAAHAQNTGVIYIDHNGSRCSEQSAMYVRRWHRVDDSLYQILDSYAATGVVMMRGRSADLELRGRTGAFVYYHGNGRKKWEVEYVGGKRHGMSQRWYPSGERSDSGTFTHDMMDGRWRYWHRNGTLMREGVYESGKRVGEWTEWYPNGQVTTAGSYRLGYPVGVHREYYPSGEVAGESDFFAPGIGMAKRFDRSGALRAEEQIVNDTVRGGTYIDGDEKHNDAKRAYVLPVPEGMEKLSDLAAYFGEHLKRPAISRREGHGGEVGLSVTIDEEGNAIEAHVERSATEALDEEALRVVRELKKWSPPRRANRVMRLTVAVPVRFELEE